MKQCLVLCGAGIYGATLLGALYKKAIDTRNIRIIAGTSVGAIIGTLLIVGYDPLDILKELMDCLPLATVETFELEACGRFGMLSQQHLSDTVRRLLLKKLSKLPTFQELYDRFRTDLIVTGTCVSQHKGVYFHRHNRPDMCVHQALMITSCVPLLFPYVEFENEKYVDGFITDNFPLRYALDFAKTHVSDEELHTDGFVVNYAETAQEEAAETDFNTYVMSLFRLFSNQLQHQEGVSDPNTDVHVLCPKRSVHILTPNRSDVFALFINT
jgi:predicted acylesterase/phospholipase RssA